MKIDVTDVSAVKKTVSIEVGPDAVKEELKRVLQGYARKAKIPGFRPGKAPMSIIQARFKNEVREDVRERVMSKYYHMAVKEKGFRPLGDPVVDEVKHEDGEPFTFKTTFEVLPDYEVDGYRGVEVRKPAVAVSETDVDEMLEKLRESRTRLKTEEGKAAATGDVIVADVCGTPDAGELFNREAMMLEVGATHNLPAFNDNLEGATAGARLEFSVDYPPDYPAAELAGKSVRYVLDVKEVKRREVPDLDDEFAKDVGDFENLEALRTRAREDLTDRKRHAADQAVKQRVLDKVLLDNPVVLPDLLVEHELRGRLEDGIRNLMLQGIDPEKADIDWVELRKSQEGPARKSVHARLTLDAVARKEALTVTEDELNDRIRADAEARGETYEKLRARVMKHAGMETLKSQLLREKSLDLLTSVANIQNEE